MRGAVPARRSRSPRVSVVIPTHDRLPMLREAVASVRQQTLEQWELIVVDDGSADGTWDWLQRQPDVRAHRLARQAGPSTARNAGVQLATAPLVAFLDSDDLFLPHKLEQQLQLMERVGAAMLCHCNERWLRGGRELRQLPKHRKRGGEIFEHCLPMCRISPSAAVVRRDLLLELGGFDEQLEVAEDYELWLRITCRHRVDFVEQPLLVKRGGHADQLSMRHGMIEVFRVEALRRVLLRAPLTPPQRAQALDVLRAKCEVVARGCDKRGRADEARRYRELPHQLG